jgi:hypothetical protein
MTLLCGDLFWNRFLANLIDANTEQWIEEDVDAFRGYLADLRAMVAGPVKEGNQGMSW